jgi:ketosteroid isomerase-like protein
MDNRQLIQDFYSAFAAGDAAGMIRCYADEIRFQDPAFGQLSGEDAKNMWRMLLKNKGIRIEVRDISATDQKGSAAWTATYVFRATGRTVVNHVRASFEFSNGKIIRHRDRFNIWSWAGQALSPIGYLLGWTPLLRRRIRKQAHDLLGKFSV